MKSERVRGHLSDTALFVLFRMLHGEHNHVARRALEGT